MNSVKISLGALALAAGLAATSFAQAPAPQGPPQGQNGGRGMMRGGPQMTPEQMQQRRDEMRQRMEQRRDERAKLMHDALGIQPNQENAWKAYQDALKPPTPPAPPAAGAAPPTTLQRLDQELARSNERAAEVKKRVDATKRFYAALTPTQQKSFEALQQMRGDRGGMMRGRMRDGFGQGGPGMRGPGDGRGFGGPGGPR